MRAMILRAPQQALDSADLPVPQPLQQHKEQAEKLGKLQQLLEKAVADEDFEQAAVLRDEIKQAREKFDGLRTG